MSAPAKSYRAKTGWVLFVEIFILVGVVFAVRYETRAVNATITDVSDLKDPSPYRVALMGHLGKIHLSLAGYLQSSDPALEKQMRESRKDFGALLPDFVHQNPKLFPQDAADEIKRTFGLYNEAIDRTIEANAHRMQQRSAIIQNFTRMLYLIDHNIRPIIRKDKADGEERSEA